MRQRNLIGLRFGKLTVVEERRTEDNNRGWLCQCDCGNSIVVKTQSLTCDHRYSCGCEHRSWHMGSRTPLYKTWTSMKQRCSNPKEKFYQYYGGKGIRVCNEWKDFAAFQKWSLNNGYVHGLQIDRIDSNGDYCPQNCRFVTPKVNANNRGNSKFYVINGEKKTLTEWCEYYQISYSTVYARIESWGWDVKKALTVPPKKYNKHIS